MSKSAQTLDDLLQAYMPGNKTAEAPSLPDNHPATGMDDATSVPTGSLIPDATAPLIEEFGTLNPDSPGSPQNQKPEEESVSIGTETGRVEDGLAPISELKDGIPDPGPDSSHPASSNNTEKFAGFTDIGGLAEAMAKQLSTVADMLTKTASAPEAPATPAPKAQAANGAPNEVIARMHPAQAKIATALLEVTAADPVVYNRMVRAHLTPFVEIGFSRASKLAEFMDMAAQDPAAAEAMLAGGGGGADPAAVAGEMGAAMGGGDPAAAMGGEMGGGMGGEGGGEDPMAAAMAEIEAIAAETGATPEEVIDQLEQLIGGAEGGEGGGEMGGGAPAPEAGAPEAPPMPEEGGEDPAKTAAAPAGTAAGKKISKEAAAARDVLKEVLRRSTHA